jgi:hypothetical protein
VRPRRNSKSVQDNPGTGPAARAMLLPLFFVWAMPRRRADEAAGFDESWPGGENKRVLPADVGLWRSWERASMAWKRSSVRSRPGPPNSVISFNICNLYQEAFELPGKLRVFCSWRTLERILQVSKQRQQLGHSLTRICRVSSGQQLILDRWPATSHRPIRRLRSLQKRTARFTSRKSNLPVCR